MKRITDMTPHLFTYCEERYFRAMLGAFEHSLALCGYEVNTGQEQQAKAKGSNLPKFANQCAQVAIGKARESFLNPKYSEGEILSAVWSHYTSGYLLAIVEEFVEGLAINGVEIRRASHSLIHPRLAEIEALHLVSDLDETTFRTLFESLPEFKRGFEDMVAVTP